MLNFLTKIVLLCSVLTVDAKADATYSCPTLSTIEQTDLKFIPEENSFKNATITYPGGALTCYYGSELGTQGNTQYSAQLPEQYLPNECKFTSSPSIHTCRGTIEDCQVKCTSGRSSPSEKGH